MLAHSFEVAATDASGAMLQLAVERHPALKGQTVEEALPEKFPFADASFDGAVAIAVLQHLPSSELGLALREVHRLLRTDTRFLVWVFDDRSDLNEETRDPQERLMTLLPPSVFLPLSESAGFTLDSTRKFLHILGRSNVKPREYVMRKSAT